MSFHKFAYRQPAMKPSVTPRKARVHGTVASRVGLVLLDSSLKPVFYNAEALSIVGYPNKPRTLDTAFSQSIRSLAGRAPGVDLPMTTHFVSGRRRYVSQAFGLAGVKWGFASRHCHHPRTVAGSPSFFATSSRDPGGAITRDGAFTIPDVANGRFRLDVSGLPENVHLTSARYGGSEVRDLLPGEYTVLAWDDVEAGAYQNPEFLKDVEHRGVKASVDRGSRNVVDVGVIN
jgi:hypothetical protein